MICLKKASTNIDNSIEKAQASCLGTSELLLVVRDLHVVVDSIGDLLLLDSIVWPQQSKCEYLTYSRDLHPGILSIYALVSNGKGRLYSGLG